MGSIDRKTRENACNKAQSIVDEMPKVGEAALSPGEHEPGFVLAYGIYLKPAALTCTGSLPCYTLMISLTLCLVCSGCPPTTWGGCTSSVGRTKTPMITWSVHSSRTAAQQSTSRSTTRITPVCKVCYSVPVSSNAEKTASGRI